MTRMEELEQRLAQATANELMAVARANTGVQILAAALEQFAVTMQAGRVLTEEPPLADEPEEAGEVSETPRGFVSFGEVEGLSAEGASTEVYLEEPAKSYRQPACLILAGDGDTVTLGVDGAKRTIDALRRFVRWAESQG